MSPSKNLRLLSRQRTSLSGPGTPEARLKVVIDLPSSKAARTVYVSLKPETRSASSFRSRTAVSAKGRTLKVEISAQDLTALRAAANSFLRFVIVSMRMLETVVPFYNREKATRMKRVDDTWAKR